MDTYENALADYRRMLETEIDDDMRRQIEDRIDALEVFHCRGGDLG